MRRYFGLALGLPCALAVYAQAPANVVVEPRGVINAVTRQPAPSVVAQGSLIEIRGLNLGPAAGAVAPAGNLPTTLGDTEVLIANRPAAIASVSPGKIVAQVPRQTPGGLVPVAVRRNGATSRPALIRIVNVVPGVRTVDDKGYGAVAGTANGRSFTFRATGLGPTDPVLEDGRTSADAQPRQPVRVHVGGVPVEAAVKGSANVGEFDITIQIPESAKPGDLIIVEAANQIANEATWQRARDLETTFLRLPGAPTLRAIAGSDLRPGYLVGSAPRTEGGCYNSIILDIAGGKSTPGPECLTSAFPNAPNPVVASINGVALAALVGPPQGDVQTGVSSKLAVFHPAREGAMTVELPGPASTVGNFVGGNFAAILPGETPQIAVVNPVTGEIQDAPGGAPGGGGGGGGAAVFLNLGTLRVDLGGGLDKILSAPLNMGQGRLALVVGDNQDAPAQAKLATISPQGEVQEAVDFPAGWAPLIMPSPPQAPAGPFAAFGRLSTFFDAQTRSIFVLARKTDDTGHAFVVFSPEGVKAQSLPEGWFIASCTPNAQVLSIETARRLVVPGSNSRDRVFQQVCGARGFVVIDLDGGQQVRAVPLPGEGQINATARATDINDFLLASNTSGFTVFALDGVTLTPYRLDLPQGVTAVGNIGPIPDMELAVAPARRGTTGAFGDAGFVVFDLLNVETRQLLLPDNIATAQQVGVLPATRKMVARGTLTGNTGSQFLVYDLSNGDVLPVTNPEGVAFVGNAPAAQAGGGGVPPGPGPGPGPGQPGPGPGQPGGAGGGQAQQNPPMMRVNGKANTIEAITFDAQRRQNGALLVRVP